MGTNKIQQFFMWHKPQTLVPTLRPRPVV